jgi:hypothetical protein
MGTNVQLRPTAMLVTSFALHPTGIFPSHT